MAGCDECRELAQRVAQLESDIAELVTVVSAQQRTLDAHQTELERGRRSGLAGERDGS